jgi:hypothetical protein
MENTRVWELPHTLQNNIFFFFSPFFPSCFFWVFLIYPFPPCVFKFSWSVPSKNLSMGTWEHGNIKI